MISYGQTIEWHGRDGSITRVSTEGHPSREAALRSALTSAITFGWTAPKWWQWWRRGDTDYTKLLSV